MRVWSIGVVNLKVEIKEGLLNCYLEILLKSHIWVVLNIRVLQSILWILEIIINY